MAAERHRSLAPRVALAMAAVAGLLLCVASAARAGLDIQTWTTPQGARVYFVENHDLQMLDVSVAFAAGSAYDRAETAGLASLTRHMMSLGAGGLSEQDIAERLADVGAQMAGFFDQDRAGFSLRSLSGTAERDAALAVLRMVLARPAFTADILEREKARAIANLREAATKPEYLGDKAFQAAIFGSHPYALPESGEESTVARFTSAGLRDFHARHYRAANMVVAVMGDLDRRAAEALAERLAADLPPGGAPAAVPPVSMPTTGSEQVIPHHATQSHLYMGLPGMKRDDPDYFPLLVGNYVLGGGGFDSRLTEEIRQKRGLSYSVYSYFMPLRERGAFQVGLQTRREATDEAVRVVRETVRRYLEEGPSEAELRQAKDNLIGSFPLRLDSNRKILDHLAMLGFYRLPLDWLDSYTRKVAAVTRDDILRAMRERVRPEVMATVIVGGQSGPAVGR
jgi:zinc protease